MSDQPPVPSPQPPAPRRLGNYEILDKLGEGGMGEVWRARDERLHRTVAVKILPADVSNDPSRRARFEQEAHALGALNHPNIVAIYDVGADDGRAYLVSELVEGESLRAMLDRGPVPVRKTIDLAGQITDGMAAAHALGIVHRDLKPENVMVTRSGQVKILDFGLAKQAPTASGENTATMALSQPGPVLGTAGYMSPEQVRAEPVDPRSDIFSFGAVLCEMLTGRRAFQAPTSVETMHAVLNAEPPEFDGELGKLPPALATIVRRCLEKRSEQRFQSAADLAFALRSITGASITGVQSAISTGQPKRKPWIWPVAALLAAALLFAAGFFLRDRTLHPAPPEFQKITFRKGLVARPRFTPDGNIVYEASWDHGPNRIYLAVPGSPESRDLGINGDFGSVSSKQQLTLFTGSTRAALRAGRKAAIMLAITPTAAAVTSSQGRTSMWSAFAEAPITPSMNALVLAVSPCAINKPKPIPTAEPARPATALSPRNSARIWPRVAPSARRMPISARRCVTAIANEL